MDPVNSAKKRVKLFYWINMRSIFLSLSLSPVLFDIFIIKRLLHELKKYNFNINV